MAVVIPLAPRKRSSAGFKTKQRSCAVRPILALLLLFCSTVYPQIVDKVLISGLAGYETHDLNVKAAFEQGYSSYNGDQFEGEITLLPQSIYSSFDYAKTNCYQMLVRSTTGLSAGIYYANYFPEVKLVMPSGSNNFQLTYNGDIETCPVIVTGAGEIANATGYKIDFYSVDPITSENLSSYSNGFVAGQLAFIANTLNCSIEDARTLAREKGTQNGVWDYYNGYGKVEVGTVLESPFPVELISFKADFKNNAVELIWETATENENYGFEIERAYSELVEKNITWEKIGFKLGHGNSNKPRHYVFVDNEKLKSGNYYYRLKQIDNDGTFEYYNKARVEISAPNVFSLSQNYPNPFNPDTNIEFTLSDEAETKIIIYDMLGNKINEYINSTLPAGVHNLKLDGSSLAAGTYIYQLQASSTELSKEYVQTRKMVLLK